MSPQVHPQPQTQCLLLIFHRNPHANNPYTLINPPGLPISNASPFLHSGAARVPETKADLLATVTEVVAGGEGGLGEYSFLMSWSTIDRSYSYVVLEKEKKVAAKSSSQGQGQNVKNAPGGAVGDAPFEDPNANAPWAKDNKASSPNNEWDSAPAPQDHAPSPDRNANLDEWPTPGSTYGDPAPASKTSGTDEWGESVREWAWTPSSTESERQGWARR